VFSLVRLAETRGGRPKAADRGAPGSAAVVGRRYAQVGRRFKKNPSRNWPRKQASRAQSTRCGSYLSGESAGESAGELAGVVGGGPAGCSTAATLVMPTDATGGV